MKKIIGYSLVGAMMLIISTIDTFAELGIAVFVVPIMGVFCGLLLTNKLEDFVPPITKWK